MSKIHGFYKSSDHITPILPSIVDVDIEVKAWGGNNMMTMVMKIIIIICIDDSDDDLD